MEEKKTTYEQLYSVAKTLQIRNHDLEIEIARLHMINKAYELKFREIMAQIKELKNHGSR